MLQLTGKVSRLHLSCSISAAGSVGNCFQDACQRTLLDTDKNILPRLPQEPLSGVFPQPSGSKLKKYYKKMSPIMGMSGVNKNRTVLFASVIDPCLCFLFLDCMEMPCLNFQRDYVKIKLAFPKDRLATQRYWLKK